jgi:capsular exopolysaccharide synthesis family protein
MEQKPITTPPANRVVLRPADAEMLSPKEILAILRRHIPLVITLTILGFIFGGASWYLLLKYFPKYTADAIIRVLPAVERDPMSIGGIQVAKDIQYGARVSVATLLIQQNNLLELIKRDKIQATKWFQSFGKIKERRIAKAVEDLRKYFGAYAQRDSDYVSLSMTAGDRKEAALIINEMIDLFLASQGISKKEDIANKLARYEEHRLRVQHDLDMADKSLADVRAGYGFTDLGERNFQDTITIKLDNLEIEQNQLVLQIKVAQAEMEALKRQAEGPVNEQVEHLIETDPVMVMLAQQLASLEAQLAGQLTKFGENHQVVRRIQQEISETKLRRQIRKAAIAEQTRQANLKNAQDLLVVLMSRLDELEKRREDAAAKKKDFDSARALYEQRLAIRDASRQNLDSINEQIGKLRIVREDPETPKIQFAGYAPEPLEISSPKWEVYFPGGTMLGLAFGIGLALLIELLNDLVRMPRDVIRYLHIPLLGAIPDVGEDEQVSNHKDANLYTIVRQVPYSIIGESYRRFRTSLKLLNIAEPLKVLLITSPLAKDGTTTIAVNLAMTFVAEGKKVLLMDANFRRPALHTIFPKPKLTNGNGEQSVFGLSTLLAGFCSYHEIIRPGGIEGLDVIDSGPLPPNPTELLGGPQMEQLVKRQKENYDYVIIDGPPVLLVSDSKMLARFADGTILVCNAAATRRGIAQRAVRETREVNAALLGCVLLAVKALKGGYFHEQFKSYLEYQELQLVNSA